jgi:uncharacterized protein YunC (DUF1805 family)
MRHHYLRLLERELQRMWINQYSVIVVELGKDKFLVSDGNRGFVSKGHKVYAAMKKLPDKAGYSKFWDGMRELEQITKDKASKKS